MNPGRLSVTIAQNREHFLSIMPKWPAGLATITNIANRHCAFVAFICLDSPRRRPRASRSTAMPRPFRIGGSGECGEFFERTASRRTYFDDSPGEPRPQDAGDLCQYRPRIFSILPISPSLQHQKATKSPAILAMVMQSRGQPSGFLAETAPGQSIGRQE